MICRFQKTHSNIFSKLRFCSYFYFVSVLIALYEARLNIQYMNKATVMQEAFLFQLQYLRDKNYHPYIESGLVYERSMLSQKKKTFILSSLEKYVMHSLFNYVGFIWRSLLLCCQISIKTRARRKSKIFNPYYNYTLLLSSQPGLRGTLPKEKSPRRRRGERSEPDFLILSPAAAAANQLFYCKAPFSLSLSLALACTHRNANCMRTQGVQ